MLVYIQVDYDPVYPCFTMFYKSQYGFRQLHSTELAALEITDRIYIDLDNKKNTVSNIPRLIKSF